MVQAAVAVTDTPVINSGAADLDLTPPDSGVCRDVGRGGSRKCGRGPQRVSSHTGFTLWNERR